MKTFTFDGKTYDYFIHEYMSAWNSERSVEVPIGWEAVKTHQGQRILEVGNVLQHYYPISHDVLDKYEAEPEVIVADIVDFKPAKKYDFVISISTLEHVGYTTTPNEPRKILRVVENLRKNCVAPGGDILVTLPVGEPKLLKEIIDKGELPFNKWKCLKRTSGDNKWKEAGWDEVKAIIYAYPFPFANAIVVGLFKGL